MKKQKNQNVATNFSKHLNKKWLKTFVSYKNCPLIKESTWDHLRISKKRKRKECVNIFFLNDFPYFPKKFLLIFSEFVLLSFFCLHYLNSLS